MSFGSLAKANCYLGGLSLCEVSLARVDICMDKTFSGAASLSPGPNVFFACEAPALGQLKGHHCVVSASCCFLYRVPRQDFGQIHTYFTGVKISPHVQYSMVPNPTRRSRTRQSCSERRRHQRHSRGIHLSIQSVLRLPDMLLPPPAMRAEFTTHSVGIRLKLVGDEASDVSR